MELLIAFVVFAEFVQLVMVTWIVLSMTRAPDGDASTITFSFEPDDAVTTRNLAESSSRGAS